jgi:hypothetical protein
MRIRKGYKVADYHIELDYQDAERLKKFCAEADMKFSSVFRRSLRKFLDVEEQKLPNNKQLFGQ